MTHYVPQKVSDALLKGATAVVRASDRETYRRELKRLLSGVFAALPKEDRYSFLRAADPEAEGGFLNYRKRWPELNDKVLEDAAFKWGAVAIWIRQGGDDFERGFVTTVEKVLQRHQKPSEKQIPIMKRMYLDWKAAQEAGSVDVIEEEE